ncbi:hypothetical protein GCM10010483_02630 [Actinokineospora diospyrosa]
MTMLLGLMVRRVRRKTVVSAPPPVLRIVTLGATAVGKTVLLAGMFDHFRNKGERLRLSAVDGVRGNALTRVWATVSAPDAGWPEATKLGPLQKFSFDCKGLAGGNEYPVARFEFIDLAGEIVDGGHDAHDATDAQRPGREELDRHIKAADAVFGIIDAYRIRQYLDKEEAGRHYVQHVILPMVDSMQDVGCPVYFIVSRWDLIARHEDEDEDQLRRVRGALLDQPAIGRLVHQSRERHQSVRLIPVSAVGRRFARFDEHTRVMTKCPGEKVRPFNVEFPLCMVIPDLFAQVGARLKPEHHADLVDRLERHRGVRGRGRAAKSAKKLLRSPAGEGLRAVLAVVVGVDVINDRLAEMFLDWFARNEQLGRNTVAADESDLARRAVIEEFQEMGSALKIKYPSSDLTRAVR